MTTYFFDPEDSATLDVADGDVAFVGDQLVLNVNFYASRSPATLTGNAYIQLLFGPDQSASLDFPVDAANPGAVDLIESTSIPFDRPVLGQATVSYHADSLTLNIPLAVLSDFLSDRVQIGIQIGNDLAPGSGYIELAIPTSPSLFGTNKADRLEGTHFKEALFGYGGDDTLIGGSSNDQLFGENGIDTINAGGGNDFVDAGNQDDIIDSGNGDDIVIGGNGHDTITDISTHFTTGSDIISGGFGNDQITEFDGVGPTFFPTPSYQRDQINGNEGNDVISGEGKLNGDAGDDQLSGYGILNGGRGNDLLEGKLNNVQPSKYSPSFFTPGDEFLGGDGDDQIFAGNGTDQLNGGNGDDYLVGGQNSQGTQKNGQFDSDTLTGGSGHDTFVLGTAAGNNYGVLGSGFTTGSFNIARIKDFTQRDLIQLAGAADRYSLAIDSSSGSRVATITDLSTTAIVSIIEGNVPASFSLSGAYFVYV